MQYKIRRPIILADGPDARHMRAWAGGLLRVGASRYPLLPDKLLAAIY